MRAICDIVIPYDDLLVIDALLVRVPNLIMDYLPYDLVEEVVGYLPRRDVRIIAKVSSRRPTLENWSFAAEDQLENRVLLDVYACVQCEPVTREVESSEDELESRIFVEGGFFFNHNIAETKIFLSATRDLPNGGKEEWNCLQWRYAWIRNLTVETSYEHFETSYEDFVEPIPGTEVDLQKALRLVSLPVDPSARGSLIVEQHLGYSREEEHDVYRRMINAVQKEFVKVKLIDREGYFSNTMEELAIGFINKGVFLEDMNFHDCNLPRIAKAEISEAVASEFGRKRGRPLEVRIPFYSEEIVSIVESIAENWHQSDGAFEEKRVSGRRFPGDLWFAIAEKYKAIVDPNAVDDWNLQLLFGSLRL
uniref:F-box domain-containing protein n=1 Tax=Steinernema glaseri TaxID=37863 RepID=A0A1I7Y4U3_9BILA